MINVMLFEDNDRLRETMELLIRSDDELHFLSSHSNCDNLLKLLQLDILPDVILMDINMPGKSGIEGVKIIKEQLSAIQIVMFTVYEDQEKIFESLKNGASGYLLKKTPPLQLLAGIKNVFNGGTPLSPEIARKIIGVFQKEKPVSKENLTERELMILSQLSHGKSYKELAYDLKISIETVRSHLKNIYTKMHVACGTEAVAKGLRLKIIE